MSIESQLRAIAAQSVIKAEKVIRLTVNDIANNTIIATPVLDGLLINNWLSGYSYSTSTHDIRDKSGSESQGSLTQSLSAYSIGKTFYFTNSLPYADAIENHGHSHRTPDGMLKKSIAQFDTIAQGYINQVK